MFGELAIRGERNVVNFESLDEVSLFGDGAYFIILIIFEWIWIGQFFFSNYC